MAESEFFQPPMRLPRMLRPCRMKGSAKTWRIEMKMNPLEFTSIFWVRGGHPTSTASPQPGCRVPVHWPNT